MVGLKFRLRVVALVKGCGLGEFVGEAADIVFQRCPFTAGAHGVDYRGQASGNKNDIKTVRVKVNHDGHRS